MRLAILGSTRGTNMLGIIEAIQEGQLQAEIKMVISNKSDAMILERAKLHGIPAYFISPKGFTREEYDRKVMQQLVEEQIDVIMLIGYMRILSAEFVAAWKNKIINVHPSLLPAFAGKMDLEVHKAVLESGVKQTGCTVHLVTEEVDAGPIVVQKKCQVLSDDTPDSLKQRVQALETPALIEALHNLSA